MAYILPNFSAGYSGLSLCTYGASGAVKIGVWKVDGNDNTKHVLNGLVDYKDVDLAYIINIAGDFTWDTDV